MISKMLMMTFSTCILFRKTMDVPTFCNPFPNVWSGLRKNSFGTFLFSFKAASNDGQNFLVRTIIAYYIADIPKAEHMLSLKGVLWSLCPILYAKRRRINWHWQQHMNAKPAHTFKGLSFLEGETSVKICICHTLFQQSGLCLLLSIHANSTMSLCSHHSPVCAHAKYVVRNFKDFARLSGMPFKDESRFSSSTITVQRGAKLFS